jgi:hypothetical protein
MYPTRRPCTGLFWNTKTSFFSILKSRYKVFYKIEGGPWPTLPPLCVRPCGRTWESRTPWEGDAAYDLNPDEVKENNQYHARSMTGLSLMATKKGTWPHSQGEQLGRARPEKSRGCRPWSITGEERAGTSANRQNTERHGRAP